MSSLATFHIHTFGCKVNQCDSQILRETLISAGLEEVGSKEADLVLMNKCTVTDAADSKFRKALRRARRENPRASFAVTGCFLDSGASSFEECPESDLTFKMRDIRLLADFLFQRGLTGSNVFESVPNQSYFSEHTRAFLKIQDGCDCSCAYCIVPTARPVLWSDNPQNVISAVNNFSSRGYKEVVLTGIHLGFYGRDRGSDGLAHLFRRIEDECDIARVRLSSIEINEVSNEILDLFANSEKFCHYLHLPLQSGDDNILKRMGRRYYSGFFADRIIEIRSKIPDIGISTDLMVGFPGETEEEFSHTMHMVEKMEFVKIHVFRFSPRPGTKAAEMGHNMSPGTVSARARRLISFGAKVAQNFKERFVGQTVQVLVEAHNDRTASCIGHSSNYINVNILDVSGNLTNQMVTATILNAGTGNGAATGRLV